MVLEFEKGKETFSGPLGWVIIPDRETQDVSRTLAQDFNSDSEYLVSTAHITLYHANLANVPLRLIEETSRTLSGSIGKQFSLDEILPYGDKFLFWDVSTPSTEIQNVHKLILGNYQQYLSKDEVAAAKEEELDLTRHEMKNLELYGHPLVFELYRPHITLLYNSSGVNLKSRKNWGASIQNIQFVEMGNYGSVKKVLSTTKR